MGVDIDNTSDMDGGEKLTAVNGWCGKNLAQDARREEEGQGLSDTRKEEQMRTKRAGSSVLDEAFEGAGEGGVLCASMQASPRPPVLLWRPYHTTTGSCLA